MVSTLSLFLEDGARFRHGAGEREADDELDNLLDQRNSGSLSQKRYLLALGALLERSPNFVDGHAHLGFAMLEQGKVKQALEACERGLSLGVAVIPNLSRPDRVGLVGKPALSARRARCCIMLSEARPQRADHRDDGEYVALEPQRQPGYPLSDRL